MIPLKERKLLVDKDVDSPSLMGQCMLLSLHRSGLYYTPSQESEENLDIMRLLDEQYLKTPFYGVERLLPLLVGMGYRINRKRLRRLMKLVGWQTLFPEKRTTVADHHACKYPYLLKNLTVDKANQVWAVGITYIPMQKGFM